MLWKWDPERKPCMLFPLPVQPVRHVTHRKHNILSDCTLTISVLSKTIHCQCCCTNAKNQYWGDDANGALFADWKLRITCRVEENKESKWIKQMCQEMSLPHKHQVGRIGPGASAMYSTKADNERRTWWTREQIASGLGYLNEDTCNQKMTLSTFEANSWLPTTTDTFEYLSHLK